MCKNGICGDLRHPEAHEQGDHADANDGVWTVKSRMIRLQLHDSGMIMHSRICS